MTAKNWIFKAALEIAARAEDSPPLRGKTVSAIIEAHCPFKPDVVYMPVPRCDECKHWHGPQKDANGREQCTEPTISPEQMDEFMTLPNFGCVRWEAK